jgi:hypothetical protein
MIRTNYVVLAAVFAVVTGCCGGNDNDGNRGSEDTVGAEGAGGFAAAKCGNAIIDGKEQCDGVDLGGKTCSSLGYGEGFLNCYSESCTYDVRLCTSDSGTKSGEYINLGDASIYDPEYYADYNHLVGIDGGFDGVQSCTKNSDCGWVAATCYCYWPELEDVVAINREWIQHYVFPYCSGRCNFSSAPWLIPRCNNDIPSDRVRIPREADH